MLVGVDVVVDGDGGEAFLLGEVVADLEDDALGVGDGFGAFETEGEHFEVEGADAAHQRILGAHDAAGEGGTQLGGHPVGGAVEHIGLAVLEGDFDQAVVGRIAEDAPLLDLGGRGDITESRVGPWAKIGLKDEDFHGDPRMPVNMAGQIAAAKIPVLLIYGGADAVVPPKINCEAFAERFKAAGGKISVIRRAAFGHHPHGLDPDKTQPIIDFFRKADGD